VRELPVHFQPSDFGGEPPTSAPRFMDNTRTDRVPTVASPAEPPTSPRKPKPKEPTETKRLRPKLGPSAQTKLGAPKPSGRTSSPPPPFRGKPSTVRNPAPSPVIDRVKEFAGDTAAEGEQFVDDSDTNESREFDDE
jgi:hypothetical protein